MDQKQLHQLKQRLHIKARIAVDELSDHSDRTLLLGIDLDGVTLHVYLYNQEINALSLDQSEHLLIHKHQTQFVINELIPTSKIFPETADSELMSLMVERGATPRFAPMGERVATNGFYAKRAEELQPPPDPISTFLSQRAKLLQAARYSELVAYYLLYPTLTRGELEAMVEHQTGDHYLASKYIWRSEQAISLFSYWCLNSSQRFASYCLVGTHAFSEEDIIQSLEATFMRLEALQMGLDGIGLHPGDMQAVLSAYEGLGEVAQAFRKTGLNIRNTPELVDWFENNRS